MCSIISTESMGSYGIGVAPNKRMQLTRCGVTRAAGHPARRLACS
jgi:hypothetical protein